MPTPQQRCYCGWMIADRRRQSKLNEISELNGINELDEVRLIHLEEAIDYFLAGQNADTKCEAFESLDMAKGHMAIANGDS